MSAEEFVQEISKLTDRFSAGSVITGIVTLILSGVVIYIIRAFMIKSLRRSENMDEQQKSVS